MTAWTADTMPYAMALFGCLAWLAVALPKAVWNAYWLVAEARERRAEQAVGEVFESYGLIYRRAGSPPSHAAGRAA